MEFSWIQKRVLLKLIRSQAARVKDLQPADVPANQFAYHLDGLVSRGLTEKLARGTYTLTAKGEKLVGTFSTLLDRQVENIKMVVMLVGQQGDKQLLFRWSRQPYLGKVTPLYDRVPVGKLLEDGINSALDDKLGVRRSVTFKNSVLIRIVHDDVIVSHMNALVYEVSLDGANMPFVGRNGEAFIKKLTDTDDCMDGIGEFFDKLESAIMPFDV
ncbi:MAG TPA: hypothetical protein VFQ70_04230, partial [Candidatus Saccharimonadaceae bacterium]|nr:hypothetical protein [Candidatus Saccharimonadaceae bacterium]